jgi:hypothetical protein
MKAILIESCGVCPNRDHNGAFGKVAYVPICRLSNKQLPYDVEVQRGREYAVAKKEIPAWCKLTEVTVKGE